MRSWLALAAFLVPAEAILDDLRCEANTITMCTDEGGSQAVTYSVVGDKCLAFCLNQCHSEGNIFMTTYCFPYALYTIPGLLFIALYALNKILKMICCPNHGYNTQYSTQMR